MIRRGALVVADVRDLVQPWRIVDMAGYVHLFPSSEGDVGQHGQEHLGVYEAYFVHKDEICALSSASLKRENTTPAWSGGG